MHPALFLRARVGVLLLSFAVLAACSGDATEESLASVTSVSDTGVGSTVAVETTATSLAVPNEPTFSYTIDPSLDRGGGVEVVSGGGVTSRFMEGRIVVVVDDPAVLADILGRYSATVIRQYSASDYGLHGPIVAVVAVDPAAADLDTLPGSMTLLGSEGQAVFGSEGGARLAAIAAAERASGHRVGLDWLASPTSIPHSTREAPPEAAPRIPGWNRDAYQLDYYRRDSVQGIGVAEAWSLMYYAGVLDNRVPIAFIDWGFSPDDDFRDPIAISLDPDWPIGEGDETGFFHGHSTSGIAVAIPDNGYGVAGVAGVVAQPILIQNGGWEYSRHIEAMLTAYDLGARIISMSFISPVLPEMAPLADALDEVTASLAASGVLLFASSGNGGGNVDEILAETDALIGTRPCQAPGVICVGGLGVDSIGRHEDSTHGNPGGSVDIYAPYCVFDVIRPGEDRVSPECGTSLSTPFAAGVAALVWAANPDLTADQVWLLMTLTAHAGRWPRVNALDAVAGALGPFVAVGFLEPGDGAVVGLNRAVSFAAEVIIPTNPDVGTGEVGVVFSSNRDGVIDNTSWTVPMSASDAVTVQRVSTSTASLSEGTHRITVTVEYEGETATASIDVRVENSPPSDLQISRPADGSEFCEGLPVQLRGDAFDINEQIGLPESAFRWRSSIDGFLGIGRNFRATGLSAGDHTIALRVTDAGGLRTITSISVEVLPGSDAACQDLAPSVVIVEPGDGDSFYVDDPTEEIGVDEHGSYVVVHIRVVVSDDHDSPGELTVDIYVRPGQPDTWVGSGTEFDVRLYLADGDCSQKKIISVIVFDSAGNESEDAIEVFVNRFC